MFSRSLVKYVQEKLGLTERSRDGRRGKVGSALRRGAGPCQSSMQRDHVGTWGTCDVVGPLLHHRLPTLEQIGALIGPFNSFDYMGETGFSHFS